MKTQGVFAPRTIEEAREQYAEAGPAAQVVVRETAKAMAFDGDEYDERVTCDVIETARDALFASLLEVHVADRETFDAWIAEHDQYDAADVDLLGSEHVGNVVWHAAPFVGSAGAEPAGSETAGAEASDVETTDAETADADTPGTKPVVAATFHEQEDAAVGTLRRNAFGRIYREWLTEDD